MFDRLAVYFISVPVVERASLPYVGVRKSSSTPTVNKNVPIK